MDKDSGMLSVLSEREASLAIFGADDDADKDGKSSGDQDDKDGKSDKSEQEKDQDDKSGDKSSKTDKVELTDANDIRAWNNFKEERDRLHGKVRAAEEERDTAKQELATLKAAGATDDDAKQQMTEMTKERDALLTTISDLRIENAFLSTPGYDWVDPDAALRLADLSSVDTDKNGNVIKTSLKAALDTLARDKPYLLKPKKDDDKQDKPGGKRSGDPAGSSRQQGSDKDKQAAESRLRSKYPALRR